MAQYIQKIQTGLALGNIRKSISLPDGTILNFLFYQNPSSSRIGFNLTIGAYVFNSINMTLTQNMIAPLGFLGKLYVLGDPPDITTIDKTSILYFEKD